MPNEKQRVNDFIPTRASLLSRIKNWSDQESWQTFVDTYWRLIYRTAKHAKLTDQEAQDVVQETLISVMKSMPTFKYDPQQGTFKSWLLQLTSWRIVDQLRKRQKRIRSYEQPGMTTFEEGSERIAALEQIPDAFMGGLEARWEAEWKRVLAEWTIEKIKQKVPRKQFRVFDLYALRMWPVSKVAKTLGVNPDYVYLTKHRVAKLLKKEAEHLRTKSL